MRRVDVEAGIMELAAGQHGLVTRRQLLEIGLSPDIVDRLVKSGRYRAIHRGIYLVGPLAATYAREMAASLACDERGVVSHWSAAAMLDLLPGTPGRVHVVAFAGDHSGRPGIHFHRIRSLRVDEVTRVEGISVTRAARTLFDLAGVAESRELERAFSRALAKGMTHRDALVAQLPRHAGRPGTSRIRALIESETQGVMTRSEAEERFLALVRAAQLPEPAVNVMVQRYEVDFFWRRERLVAEVDGHEFHSSPGSFESDRRRDAVLAAAGIRVVRVTWKQLIHEPHALIAILAQALVYRPAG